MLEVWTQQREYSWLSWNEYFVEWISRNATNCIYNSLIFDDISVFVLLGKLEIVIQTLVV